MWSDSRFVHVECRSHSVPFHDLDLIIFVHGHIPSDQAEVGILIMKFFTKLFYFRVLRDLKTGNGDSCFRMCFEDLPISAKAEVMGDTVCYSDGYPDTIILINKWSAYQSQSDTGLNDSGRLRRGFVGRDSKAWYGSGA